MMLHSQNITPDRIENFLAAIEVEQYYETMFEREQTQEGVKKCYHKNLSKMIKIKILFC